eukprot:scaffold11461_cov104-Isochrysis_galbana.AAC.4
MSPPPRGRTWSGWQSLYGKKSASGTLDAPHIALYILYRASYRTVVTCHCAVITASLPVS